MTYIDHRSAPRQGCVLILCAFVVAGCGPSIHDASAFGQFDVVKSLVEADPSLVNAPSVNGKTKNKTPIFYAITSDRQEIVDYLIEQGADLSARDDTGYTPLHIAALMGRVEITERLLEAGADPDIRDDFGDTPMHVLGHSRFAGDPDRRRDVMRALIKGGATPNPTNTEGKTPLDLARESFRDDGIEAFEEAES